MILPRIIECKELTRKVKLLDYLETWELKNNPSELCTEFQELIINETELRQKMMKNSDLLQRLQSVVTDLYVDWERAKGRRR